MSLLVFESVTETTISRLDLFLCVCPQGAWGGGLLMSRKHRHKLNGIERYLLHVAFCYTHAYTKSCTFLTDNKIKGENTT